MRKLFKALLLITILIFISKEIAEADSPDWTPIAGNEYNMVVYGEVHLNGAKVNKEGYWLGAFGTGGDNDCRAVSMIDPNGSSYLTVRGNANGEIIRFKMYDSYYDHIYEISQTIFFQADHTQILNLYLTDVDMDGDGAGPSTDCDDNDPERFPGNSEACDGIDNDCDEQVDEGVLLTFYADSDGDGFGNPSQSIQGCDLPEGYVTNDEDCDDTNPDVTEPNADFSCSTMAGNAPLEVNFEADFAGQANFNWEFGDGGISRGIPNPTHTYTKNGVYNVTLAVDINGKCLTKETKTIRVFGTNRLTGTVYSRENGRQTVAGALVSVVANPEYKATTNASGVFTIPDLRLGNHTLKIVADGYETKFETVVNKEGEEIAIYLNSNVGWICGRVLELRDPNHPELGGDPNKPVSASVMAFTNDGGFYAKEALVDPNAGTYIVYLGHAGHYTILASAGGYNPYLDSNQGAGYFINPADPNTYIDADPDTCAGGVDINMRSSLQGPRLKVYSFERDVNQDPNIIENETVIRVAVETGVPLDDPNVTIIKKADQTALAVNEVTINEQILYEAVYSDTNAAIHTVNIQISAMDQNGVTEMTYSFTVHPSEETDVLRGTSHNFIPAQGIMTDPLGGLDLDGDGNDDYYDSSYVYIYPFGIVADPNALEADPNFVISSFNIQVDLLAGTEDNTITGEYDINLMDNNGNQVTNFIVNEDYPITIYLYFDPAQLGGVGAVNLANLVIKYKGADGIWKTDGISNVRLEGNMIVFEVTHLTTFAAFEEDMAPTDLTAQVLSSSSIKLDWQDNAINELNFEIMRCVDNGLNNPADPADYDLIATLDPDVITYTDEDCSEGNTYYYVIRAVNEFGATDWSNVAQAGISAETPEANHWYDCFISATHGFSKWTSITKWFSL